MLQATESRRASTRWNGRQPDAVRRRKRRANEYMRDALRLLDPDEPIPFFCECHRTECVATVWLTGRGFDHLRTKPDQGLSAHEQAFAAPARA